MNVNRERACSCCALPARALVVVAIAIKDGRPEQIAMCPGCLTDLLWRAA